VHARQALPFNHLGFFLEDLEVKHGRSWRDIKQQRLFPAGLGEANCHKF
jgi:hypothetical protein